MTMGFDVVLRVPRAVNALSISILIGSNTRLEVQTLMYLSIGKAGKKGQMHSRDKKATVI